MASVPPQGLLPTNLHMAMRHPFLFQQMALFSLLGPTYGTPEMMRRLLFSQDMPLAKLREYFDYVQAESQVVALDMMGLNPLRLNPRQLRMPILVLGARQRCLRVARDGRGNRPLLPRGVPHLSEHGPRHDAGAELARAGGLPAGLAGTRGRRPAGSRRRPERSARPQPSPSGRGGRFYPSRNSRRRILPTLVLGSSARNSTRRGTL